MEVRYEEMEERNSNLEQEEGFSILYRDIIDNSLDAIYVVNRDTHEILYANKFLCRAIKNDFYLRQKCYHVLKGREEPCEDCMMYYADGVEKDLILPATGRVFSLRCRSDQWNEIPVHIVSATDVTEARKAEQRLKDSITNLKKVEEALWRSEQRYKLAVEGAGVSLWEYDFENKRIIQSAGSLEKHGLDIIVENVPESLVESGYILPEEAQSYRELFYKMRQGENGLTGDFWIPTAKKDGRWCERITYSNVFDENGKAIWAYGASQDVTQLKQMEKRFNEEVRYHDKMVNSIIATCSVNLTQGIVESMRVGTENYLQEKYHDTVEFRKRAAAFLYKSDLTEEQNRMLNPPYLMELYQRGFHTFSQEYLAQLNPNKYLWMRTDVNLLQRPETGDIVAFFYNKDITEEKTRQIIMEHIIETDYDLVCRIDANCNHYVIYAHRDNTILPPLTGENYNQSVYELVSKACNQEERERVIKNLQFEQVVKELKTKKVFTYELDLCELDGSIRRKQYQFFYMNQKAGFIIMIRLDIDDIVKKEQAKQELLEKTLLEAEKANNSKSDFMARMSHDMRTPMNAILGLAALGMDEAKDESIKQYFENISLSASLLMGLVSDVLDMAKLENGSVSLYPMPYSFEDFIKQINVTIRPQCEAKNILFAIEIGSPLPPYVLLDPLRFNQILFNLLSNAVKFTPDGGNITMLIFGEEKGDKQLNLKIVIKDDGIGMSEKFQSQMFEPFVQEHSSILDNAEGSGLGLPITKRMVELMGGSITAESVLGKGSQFTVEMEVEICEIPDNSKNFSDNVIFTILQGKRILLCEDHDLNKQIIVKLLEKQGMIVEYAPNGKVGFDLFRTAGEGYYDAILMDICMPVMDGLTAVKKIRGLEKKDAKSIPILAMTANAYKEDVEKSKEAGMNDHMAKPINPQNLYKMLAAYLEKEFEEEEGILKKLEQWGCDIPSALNRVLQDEKFLLECMEQIVVEPAFDELLEALRKEELEHAFESAHSLKGVISNIGVIPLYECIAAIVEALRERNLDQIFEKYQKLIEKKQELKQLLLHGKGGV